jgi:hypothetical protein
VASLNGKKIKGNGDKHEITQIISTLQNRIQPGNDEAGARIRQSHAMAQESLLSQKHPPGCLRLIGVLMKAIIYGGNEG